jgi:hypothetical protein
VGVFRCVFERTISRKSAAVGTGAIALRPLVDIVVSSWAFAHKVYFITGAGIPVVFWSQV